MLGHDWAALEHNWIFNSSFSDNYKPKNLILSSFAKLQNSYVLMGYNELNDTREYDDDRTFMSHFAAITKYDNVSLQCETGLDYYK